MLIKRKEFRFILLGLSTILIGLTGCSDTPETSLNCSDNKVGKFEMFLDSNRFEIERTFF